MKWDGTAWALEGSRTGGQLRGVWGPDANNIWAVGDFGTVVKWNGTTWTAQRNGTAEYLGGVWGHECKQPLAGRNFGGHPLERNCPVHETQRRSDLVSGVWGLDANNVWAVGGGDSSSTILKWDGGAWATQDAGTPNALSSIWGLDASNIWAVGFYPGPSFRRIKTLPFKPTSDDGGRGHEASQSSHKIESRDITRSNVTVRSAVGYIRVSTDMQAADGLSLDAQAAAIEQYCAMQGLKLVEIHGTCFRAEIAERPGLQDALRSLQRGVDVLVVLKFDGIESLDLSLLRAVRDVLPLGRRAGRDSGVDSAGFIARPRARQHPSGIRADGARSDRRADPRSAAPHEAAGVPATARLRTDS